MEESPIVSDIKGSDKQTATVQMQTSFSKGVPPERNLSAEDAVARTTYEGETAPEADNTMQSTEQKQRQAEQPQETQEQLLAGKYKSVQELEKAYGELQQKLGQTNEEAPQPEQQTAETADDNLYNKAYDEWSETGQVTEATIDSLVKSGIPREYVNQFIKQANAEQELMQQQIINDIGGQAEFERINTWAVNNLKPAEIESFNNIVDTGDIDQIKFAYESLKARSGNKFIQGDATNTQAETGGFSTKSDMISAISDKRYQSDAIYRRQVEERIMRSRL